MYAGLKRAERRRIALLALEAVGLSDRVDHLPSELSGGQQQRVAVARALATRPAMILADEPTGNLDSESTREVLEIFARLNDRGRTIVLITHEDDVAAYARRVVRLRDGVVVSDTARPRGGAGVIESIRLALQGIMANRLRSALTMLGILIGVAAVIILIAVGAGSSAAVQNQLAGLGTNTLTIFPTGGFGRTGRRCQPHGDGEPPGAPHREGRDRSRGQDERPEHRRGRAGGQRERHRDLRGRDARDRARHRHDPELLRGSGTSRSRAAPRSATTT